MTARDELERFVREALNGGASREEVSAALRGAGWAEAQVMVALAGFAATVRRTVADKFHTVCGFGVGAKGHTNSATSPQKSLGARHSQRKKSLGT